MNGKLIVQPGDLITQKEENGSWAALKVLGVDTWPDGHATAHCLVYRSIAEKPTAESLDRADVLVWHAPIDAGSFATWERIGSRETQQDELRGFIEYLKHTDFPRYIAVTGQDSSKVVRDANDHYRRAHSLGEQGKREEAIAEYTQAVELFPLFFEAIDNRAFTYMELGKLREALSDFDQSLQVNPSGVAAFFSRGECLMKLGELASAETIFREGQQRFPEQRATFTDFLDRVRALQASKASSDRNESEPSSRRPWWKLW